MPLYVKGSQIAPTDHAWHQLPANRLMWLRTSGVWKPILDMWVKGAMVQGPAGPPTFTDPFDVATAWAGGAVVAGGRTGNGFQVPSISIGQGGGLHTLTAAQQSDTVTVGFAAKFTTLAGDNNVLSFYGDAGATLHTSVQLGNGRNIFAWRGPASLLGSTNTGTAYPAAGAGWFYVEAQVTLHDTAGVVIVRINGTPVLNLTNVDTKNAGTGTVIDTVRLSSGSSANGGIVDDFYLTPGATFLGDINASSPPTFTDHDWHKLDYTAPNLATPTNMRVTSPATDHSQISVAWNYAVPAGGFEPDQFIINIADSNGTPQRYDYAGPGARSFTCTSIPQNAYWKLSVLARYPGRADSAWSNVVNWYTGYDAYWVTNGTANYGWGGDEHYKPYTWSVSSAANGDYNSWGGQWMFDDNWGDNSRWNSDVVNEALSGYQGEGYRVWVPRDQNWKVRGIVSWNFRGPHTIWVGYSHDGYTWQGGGGPLYVGKYGFLQHNYVYGQANAGTWDANATLKCLDYPIYNQPSPIIDVLYQVPVSDGYSLRCSVVEMRVLVNKWMILSYSDRLEPARNSGAW